MRFRDQPIARKALTLGVLPAVATLLMVTAAFAVAVFLTVRGNLLSNSEALVAIVAENVESAVSFDDPTTADLLLEGFDAERNVDKVCVYGSDGLLLGSYRAPGQVCMATDFAMEPTVGDLVFQHPVTTGNKRVGTVFLTANTSTLWAQMRTLGIVAVATLLISGIIAWTLSLRMQRSVAGPIVALAQTAEQVADTRQFGLRAVKTTNDEVGQLVDAFNGMLDQIQRQDRMKDEFLATLSHELRTPLNATLGWLQVLQKTEPDAARVERALSSIERNARAQQRVIEDLLDISRIVTGRLQMASEVIDLRGVLTAAVDVVAESAARKSLTLTAEAPASPCFVSADSGRLQQALWNLLANSIKFTPSGGRVTADSTIRERTYEVIVRDTGIGIAPEFLPRVFDRFQQADGSTTREYAGLGLGLAIVQEIAALHGGDVTASSGGLGQGATFVLSLPRLMED